MANKELYQRLCEVELKRKSSLYRKFFGSTWIDEIQNHRSSQLPPRHPEDKLFRDTLISRFAGCYWTLPFIPAAAGAYKVGWFFPLILLFPLLIIGVGRMLDTVFRTHIIEINSHGMRLEKDSYTWSQIEGVFILLPPGRWEIYKLVIAVNGGEFKTYDLKYYVRPGTNIQQVFSYYIAPHLPLSE